MKNKSTLQWTEAYLRSLKVVEECDSQTITAITELLKFHSTLLQGSAEQRLDELETKMKIIEQDISLSNMGGKR